MATDDWLELTLEDRWTPSVILVRLSGKNHETGEGALEEAKAGEWLPRGSRVMRLAVGELVDRLRGVEAERDRLRGIVEGVIAYRCPEDPTWECAMQMGEYQSRLEKELSDAG